MGWGAAKNKTERPLGPISVAPTVEEIEAAKLAEEAIQLKPTEEVKLTEETIPLKSIEENKVDDNIVLDIVALEKLYPSQLKKMALEKEYKGEDFSKIALIEFLKTTQL